MPQRLPPLEVLRLFMILGYLVSYLHFYLTLSCGYPHVSIIPSLLLYISDSDVLATTPRALYPSQSHLLCDPH